MQVAGRPLFDDLRSKQEALFGSVLERAMGRAGKDEVASDYYSRQDAQAFVAEVQLGCGEALDESCCVDLAAALDEVEALVPATLANLGKRDFGLRLHRRVQSVVTDAPRRAVIAAALAAAHVCAT